MCIIHDVDIMCYYTSVTSEILHSFITCLQHYIRYICKYISVEFVSLKVFYFLLKSDGEQLKIGQVHSKI